MIDTSKMTKAQKLELLDELLMNTYIEVLQEGQLRANDLGAVVTYLKNNKVVQEKKEHSESDLIDSLIE